VRDYIHVVDLVSGHLAALGLLERPGDAPLVANLCTGRGCSVLEIERVFERATGRAVPHRIVERRPGDVAVCYVNPGLAKRELGWSARFLLEDMCRDAWNWQQSNGRA
jgi:UDP-glucose 4-epimerase